MKPIIRTSSRSVRRYEFHFFFKLSKKRRKKKCNDNNPSENVENIKILTRVPQTHVPHRYFPSILQRRQTIVSSPLRPIQSPIREARNHGDHARDSRGWVKGESLQMRKCVAGSQGSGARSSWHSRRRRPAISSTCRPYAFHWPTFLEI